MTVEEADIALRKAQEEAKSAEVQRDAEFKVVREKWAPEIERTTKALRLANYDLGKAREEAASHPWVGKVVCKTERKKTGGSSWRPTYEKVEVRGVVEIVGPSNPWAGRKYNAPDHGTPAVRLLRKDGKPGMMHEVLSRFTLDGDATEWSLVEP